MTTAWRWFLAAGLGAVAVELVLPVGTGRDVLYLAIAYAAPLAILVGVRVHRPRRRLPWMLLAAGSLCWAVGDTVWSYYADIAATEPFPSAADVFYLLAYPLLAGAMYQFTRGASRRGDVSAVIDALITATAATVVLWVWFIEPTWTDPAGTLLERVVGVAYPIGDVLLVAQLLHLGALPVVRATSVRLLGLGIGAVLVADVLFQAAGYVPAIGAREAWLDVGWLVGYLLWGACALHPSMHRTTEVPGVRATALTTRRVAFLALSALVLPGVLLVELALGQPPRIAPVAVTAVLLIGLVLVRMLGMVRYMREQAARLARLADTDFITGLENARRFSERIDDLLTTPPGQRDADRPGAAILLIAVERLGEVNDTLGLGTGDELLRAIGERLRESVADDGVVARMGGVSFGVLLPGVLSGDRAATRAADLHRAFATPFALPEMSVSVDISVGIAIAPTDAQTATALLARADVALSAARQAQEHVARYAEQMEMNEALTPQLMGELVQAMADGDVIVHYQPQVEIASGRVLGVEALVRWQHPQHGLLGPGAFVPAAERTGLIGGLTRYVLDRALAQAAAWRAEGCELNVSVNLSVRNLLDPAFVTDVQGALTRHRIPARCLELEVTETMAMLDPHRSVEVLGALADLGVLLSLDDYGTGHSSLAYLQRLPLRRLKIDRSFVTDVLTDKASAAIVRSTIELARHLGLSVVAEGVEDDETLVALRDMRCFAAQGFGLARPASPERIPGIVTALEERIPEVVAVGLSSQRTA